MYSATYSYVADAVKNLPARPFVKEENLQIKKQTTWASAIVMLSC